MIQVTTFFVLASLGAVNAGYLTYKHYQGRNKPLICPLNHDCSVVTESKWSHFLGIRNEVLGLLFFCSILVAMLVTIAIPAWETSPYAIPVWEAIAYLFLRIATVIGALFSALLVGIQMFKIKDYCFYCIISAAISALVCVNAFFL